MICRAESENRRLCPYGQAAEHGSARKNTHILNVFIRRKHKMKKYIALALATLMAVLCFASCGKKDNEPTDNAAPSVSDTTEATTVA